MTDPINPGGWPDATRPGWPANPDEEGWHIVENGKGWVVPRFWRTNHWEGGINYSSGITTPAEAALCWIGYLGPVLTPAEIELMVSAAVADQSMRIEAAVSEAKAEIAAQVAAARAEERELRTGPDAVEAFLRAFYGSEKGFTESVKAGLDAIRARGTP